MLLAFAIITMPLAGAIEATRVHDHGPHIMGSLMRSTWVRFERGIAEIKRKYGGHGHSRWKIGKEISWDFSLIWDRVRPYRALMIRI